MKIRWLHMHTLIAIVDACSSQDRPMLSRLSTCSTAAWLSESAAALHAGSLHSRYRR